MRTVEQGLTFQEAEEAFARYHVDFTEDKYIALGLRNIHDDQYTNLALTNVSIRPKSRYSETMPIRYSRMRRSLAVLF